jgi:leucyl-tRNA synthetase
VHRFLQRLWRNVIDERTGEARVTAEPADDETRRVLHRTIDAVRSDMDELSFNTAIARLFELNNRLTQVVGAQGEAPEEVVVPLVLMTAPLAPHAAEELWERLGHEQSLAFEDFPTADPQWLAVDTVEIAIQVNGKVRARVVVASGLDEAGTEAAVRKDDQVSALLADQSVRKAVVVPGRLVNFVLG